MTVKVNEKILLEHVGAAPRGLLEAINFELSMDPEWRAMWDGRASVQVANAGTVGRPSRKR